MDKELKELIEVFSAFKKEGYTDKFSIRKVLQYIQDKKIDISFDYLREMPYEMSIILIPKLIAECDKNRNAGNLMLMSALIDIKKDLAEKQEKECEHKDKSNNKESQSNKEDYDTNSFIRQFHKYKQKGVPDISVSIGIYRGAKQAKYSFSLNEILNKFPYSMAIGLLIVHKASLMVEPVSEFRPLGSILTNIGSCDYNILRLISGETIKQEYSRTKLMNGIQLFLYRSRFFRNYNSKNDAPESNFRTKELSKISVDLEYAVKYFKQIKKADDNKKQSCHDDVITAMFLLPFYTTINKDRMIVEHCMREKYNSPCDMGHLLKKQDLLELMHKSCSLMEQHRLYKEANAEAYENVALRKNWEKSLKDNQWADVFASQYYNDCLYTSMCKSFAEKDGKKPSPDTQHTENKNADKQPNSDSELRNGVYKEPIAPVMKGKIDQSIIKEAMRILSGERQADYGDPVRNFVNIARIISGRSGHDVSPIDCVNVLLAVKECREEFNHKRDNVVDYVAYQEIKQRILEWCKTHDWMKD